MTAVTGHRSAKNALHQRGDPIYGREIGLVALGALSLFTLIALVSYVPTDPGFSYTGDTGEVRNLVGKSGAWFADFSLYLLGRIAYLLPLVLLWAGVRLVRFSGQGFNWPLFMVRVLGWVGVVVCGCTLFQLHGVPYDGLPAGLGGIVGNWLTGVGLPVFGWVGLSLLCLTGIVVGIQAAVGFSWLDIAEAVGRWIHAMADRVLAWFELKAAAWRQHRQTAQARAALVAERKQSQKRERMAASPLQDVNNSNLADNTSARSEPVVQMPATRAASNPADATGSGLKSLLSGKLSSGLSTASRPAKSSAAPNLKVVKKLTGSRPIGAIPQLDLLDDPDADPDVGYTSESLSSMSKLLEIKLLDFGIEAEVVTVLPGPVVTRFEIQPAAGVKVQKISSLAKDLARSLAVISVRIVEVIPGKSVVGIEIPNEQREVVRLKDVLQTKAYQDMESPLALALGKDVAGEAMVADIAKMPHLLIAGTTGSGKSVGVNAMLLSILYKATPDQVRLIMVDPKMLELSVYEGIPHLLTPVVTDMKEAAHALNWCVAEMERRYRLMAAMGVRNLAGFNRKVKDALVSGKGIEDPLWSDETVPAPLLEPLPFIVVFIDEFADMMMVVGKKVEQLIARIAQKARAAGIHLVLATQRPSVDVITGLIKANIPTRMGFQVSSKVDSRTILDQGGAEQLLGNGDMLYLPPGTAVPSRVHGAFVSDEEVHRVVSDWKARAEPDYLEDVLTGGSDEPFVELGSNGTDDNEDALYDEAVNFVIESRRASISSVQRKMRIGYNRAARLIESMELAGVVTEMGSNGSREVLVPKRN